MNNVLSLFALCEPDIALALAYANSIVPVLLQPLLRYANLATRFNLIKTEKYVVIM